MNLARRSSVLVVLLVLVASACQWPSMRGGPTNAAFADDETTLALDDAGTVSELFTADLGNVEEGWQTPVVSGSQIFAPSADGLAAYDLNGVTGCSGAPKTCAPLWRGDVGGRTIATAATATGTTVYVTAGFFGSDSVTLFAFDVRGETGCTGSPRRCQPLWTATGLSWAPPVVVGANLYVATSSGRIAAFDAGGTTGCSGTPKVCTPQWSTVQEGANSSPVAVAGGRLFHTTFEGELWVYDAAGVTGCSGSPKVCQPQWIGMTGGEPDAWPTSPVISGGRVYVAMDQQDDVFPATTETLVTGFALDGGTDCVADAGTQVCQPEWSATVDGVTGSNEIAAAYGSIYVQTSSGSWPSSTSHLFAIETGDASCAPGPCDATWSTSSFQEAGLASPIVANGVVYADKRGSALALDAHGVVGCTGMPRTCEPVTFASYPDISSTGWGIANGKLVVITDVGAAHQTLRVIG